MSVSLRPLAAADAPALAALHAAPEIARWWGAVPDGFPLSDDPSVTRFVIEEGGEIAGLVQFGQEPDPEYRHAWVDLFVDPARQGRGLGTEALVAMCELLGRHGHHRVTIDPAVDNAPAIRCYEKAGFRRVGVMELAWRDPAGEWRDAVLMERVLRRPRPARLSRPGDRGPAGRRR